MSKEQLRGNPWRSLLEYALGCVEAESAQTMVPLDSGPDDNPWFFHDSPEMLVTGRADHAKASAALAEFLDQKGKRTASRSSPLIYGWPTIVMTRAVRLGGGPPRPQIAPLFVIRIEQTKSDQGWTLTAAHEPEFNLAALANRPENADTADEIRKLVLPFGDAEGVAQAAAQAAQLLGYDPPALDPDQLERLEPTARGGVHNAAVFLAADFNEFRALVHQELRELARKEDWADTAAAWLVGKASDGMRKPSGPLAAVLQANHSQEAILSAIRTKPLTVVTGPPGTGKTQLVVNAVANAWLDDETVLVASTNNAAVDVAVDRAAQDVMQGLLIRTGNRAIKQQVAQSISLARTNARKFTGPPTGTAIKALGQSSSRRSRQIAKVGKLENLDRQLLRKVHERTEAHIELVEATAALRPATERRAAESGLPAFEEVRIRVRAAGADLIDASEQHGSAAAFRPRKPRSCGLRTRSDFNATEVERIRNRAVTLIGSGLFQFFERRKLREHVGCPRDTSMERIREWALIWQEAEAERLREREAARRKEAAAKQLVAARRTLTEALGCEDGGSLVDNLRTWMEVEHRLTKIEEAFESLRKSHEQLKITIGNRELALEQDREWSHRSLAAVQAKVAERLVTARAGALAGFSSVSMHNAPFGQAVKKAFKVFQGWACTALSVRGSFPLEAGLFDLVIVDEASQCCLADILPLAYRAKRIVVAGDPHQLRAITVVGDAHLRQIAGKSGYEDDVLRERGVHHKDGSAYEAFDYAGGSQPYLLDEHYRCHPHIAKWFNETFYGGDLNVLSDVTESVGGRAVVWRDVAGRSRRPRGRGGWVNEAQAHATVELLEELITPESTIGVVAPYAAQGALIDHLARQKIDEDLLAEARFVAGTAHKLQGSERDTVIFSSTFTPNMPLGAANWIEQERNLMNVAVSRARRMLVVVGHPDLEAKHSGTLASLREHILAVEDTATVGASRAAPVQTHSEAERLLLDAMHREGLEPLGKLDVEGFELDFALMDGPVMLNVEVDGDHHLDSRGRQRRNDLARDEILGRLGWEVIRIPAWRCHDVPDEAADEIRSAYEHLSAS